MREESHSGARPAGRWIFLLIVAATAGGIVGAWVMSLVIDKPPGSPEAGRSDATSLSRDIQALAVEMSKLRQAIDAQGHPLTSPEQVPDGAANPRPLVATPDTEALLQQLVQAITELSNRTKASSTSQLVVPPPDPKRRERVLDLGTKPTELSDAVFLRTRQQILDDLGRPDIVYMMDGGIERWSWLSGDPSQPGVRLDFHDGHVVGMLPQH